MKTFHYQRRSPESIEKRAAQQSGEFIGIFRDEYRVYQPAKGTNFIRILPPTWEDAEHYGYDIWVHYQIGPDKASVVCIHRMFGRRCPICDEAARVSRDSDDEAKALASKRRVGVWILDKNKPESGPLLWAMPWSLDRAIAKISKDRHSGEMYVIDDPDAGYNVSFDKDGEGIGTKYSGEQLDRRATSVPDDALDFIANNPLPDALIIREYDELLALFEGGERHDDDDRSRGRRRDEERASGRRPAEDDDEPRTRRRPTDDDEPRPRRRPADDDEPRTRRAPADDDEERVQRRRGADDGEPTSRRRPVDDNDDERPARRRPADDDDDRPARRRTIEEDEPLARRRVQEEDEPPARRRTAENDDPPRQSRMNGDDPPPRRRPTSTDEDDRETPRRRSPAPEENSATARAAALRQQYGR